MAKLFFHKIGLYIRVSTEEQAVNPEGSIRNQEERLRGAVHFKNQNGKFGEVVDVFIDRARSGKDTNRPELQRLLKAIRQKEISVVMVTELSRLSRSIKDFASIWDLMREHSCSFLSLNESFDTTTAAGEMVMYNMANLAQFERRQVVERVTASVIARAERGLYNGGCVPLGYKLNPDRKGYLEVDEEQTEIVKECFITFLREGTMAATAKSLNDRGIRPKRYVQGGGRHKRLGVFTVDTIWTILKNKAYLGIKSFSVKGEVKEVKAVWPAVIDEVTFKRVQRILKKNFRSKKPKDWSLHPYLLTGRIRCSACGDTLCGKSATGSTKKIPYYEHANATKRQSGLSKKFFKCQPVRFSANRAEEIVWQKVIEVLCMPKLAEELLKSARKQCENSKEDKEIKRIKARICGFKSQLDALAERLSQLPKTVSATPFFNQMEKLEYLKREDEERLGKLQSNLQTQGHPAEFKDYQSFLTGLKKLSEGAGHEVKMKIINALIHKVELSKEILKIHYYVGAGHVNGESNPKGLGSPSFFVSKTGKHSLNKVLAFKKPRSNQRRQVNSSHTIDNGEGCDNLLELTALSISIFYAAAWKRDFIDYTELASKRWVEKWSMDSLAVHFDCGRTTVIRYLGLIRENPNLVGDGDVRLRIHRRKNKFMGSTV